MSRVYQGKRNRRFTHRGESLLLREWSERLNIPESTLRTRLHAGWTLDMALSTPKIVEPLRGTDGVFVSAIEPEEAR